MVREVARLVSDSTCSSVLLSDGVPLLSAAGVDTTGAGGATMSKLGVTWNLPTVTGAGWTPVKPKIRSLKNVANPFQIKTVGIGKIPEMCEQAKIRTRGSLLHTSSSHDHKWNKNDLWVTTVIDL